MRRGRWLVVAVVIAVAAIVGALALRARSGKRAAQADAQAQRPVPVSVAPVERRDVPIYLEGLGTVVAYRTVTVRTQVDGRLEAVKFREGQAVRQGEVLAQIDPRPFQAQLDQAKGALLRDQAALRNARINAERSRKLVAQNLVAQQQLDADLASMGQFEGAVEIDRAAIETAQLNLDYARIVSPVDGVTGIRLVDPGNIVHITDTNGIVVVTQLDPVGVIFTMPQDHLSAVSEQLARGSLPVDAYSRDGSTLLGSGQLELIDNQINQATASIRLKAIVPNPRRALWPNQFVNARLRLETRRDALVMPATALQRGPTGSFVYVLGGEGSVSQRPVEIEEVQGELALVTRGVAEGERVVVDGQNQIRPGSRVVAREVSAPAARRPVARDGSAVPPTGDGPR
jgi:multidrug efflux system membrane fusion protein